ncbi:MAG: hypothetical protein EXR98_09565 [Gemmataceae bacterium]|nr:hypothetical protein [Gemmataceae bacterium]
MCQTRPREIQCVCPSGRSDAACPARPTPVPLPRPLCIGNRPPRCRSPIGSTSCWSRWWSARRSRSCGRDRTSNRGGPPCSWGLPSRTCC